MNSESHEELGKVLKETLDFIVQLRTTLAARDEAVLALAALREKVEPVETAPPDPPSVNPI